MDLANLLIEHDIMYDKIFGKREKRKKDISSIAEEDEEESNREILYSSMQKSTMKEESEIDVIKG